MAATSSGGPIVLDLNTHVSAAMAELIAAGPWLTVYRLQPYAHELNPVEPVRSYLQRSLTALKRSLTALMKIRLTRLQYRPGAPAGFLAGTRLDLGSFR